MAYSEAQKRANLKYLSEKVEVLKIHVPKGRKDYYKDAAAAAGQSLTQFTVRALDEKIERDGLR